MMELIHSLTDWLLDFSDSQWAILILGLLSFSESIFFPIPPDPLLIAMGIIEPGNVLWLSLVVTVSSVLGAIVGHFLGKKLGRPLARRIFDEKKLSKVELLFTKYGSWAILMAAFTPIPYKIFTVLAGVVNMDRRTFIIASIVGRGIRFFLLGGLIFAFGDAIESFLNTDFNLVTVLIGLVLVVVFCFVVIGVNRYRSKKSS
tara:strand:+ start:22684 stop:23289 length:606 start_codon:yes stop_codon:yes gene_type:complete